MEAGSAQSVGKWRFRHGRVSGFPFQRPARSQQRQAVLTVEQRSPDRWVGAPLGMITRTPTMVCRWSHLSTGGLAQGDRRICGNSNPTRSVPLTPGTCWPASVRNVKNNDPTLIASMAWIAATFPLLQRSLGGLWTFRPLTSPRFYRVVFQPVAADTSRCAAPLFVFG
jgi:hypothetical protein